ncbi:TPA: hypothetical protein TVN94_000041 [Streptococcus equi subsp. zooepidemicus]|nr:phage tail family protein [Streptococcus equi subsp. zooepidemicus]QUQ78346.1 hypothetical protein JDBNIEOD_01382 [Streptococcus equi subsp. zooepidemicus]HEK9985602.1 hypothetical protein [Streptococcus equi subsp. zooepidemicus]HEL0645260.1 hypothetical protein [Streptococcus equi subsp. zooepidemicus]HEL1035793.1 hypothetical protein [Streptococcus equi subsp. zooepidemicus]
MYGMKIGEFHSYIDFGLVPTSKPIVNLPSPKFEYLGIPGRHGEIDITESLIGEVIYEMRTGSFEFVVSDSEKWQEVYRKLLSMVHGKKTSLILDTEKDYVYKGRLWVSEFKSDKNYSLITLDYKLEPYKYSLEDMKNGEFIHRVDGIAITSSNTITLTFDSDMTIVPEFHNRTENVLTLNFEEKKFTLPKGMSRFPEVRGRKNLVLTFTGSSTIDISYQRGWL